MAAIIQRGKKKVWYAIYRDLNGKQRWSRLRDAGDRRSAQAAAHLLEMTAQRRKSAQHIRKSFSDLYREFYGEGMPVATARGYAETWLDQYKSEVASSSFLAYKKTVQRFLEFLRDRADQDDAVPLDQGMREVAQMLGYGDIYAAHESENERFDWISRDPLMRDIVHMIATGNWKGLRTITDVVGNYETNYEKQSAGQTTATVWTIAACDLLYEEGLYRNQVTKAEIQARAERLWARAMCHRKRVPPTRENIEKEKSKLSTIRWQRVWELLALEDITNAPAGRPPKNR
jgi:hypothetical protein